MNGASVDSNEQELHPIWIFFIPMFPHISRAITIILPVNAKIGWLINASRLFSSTIQPEVGSGIARSGTHKRSAHLCIQLMISWLWLTNDLSWLACCWYLTDRKWHFRYRYWSFFLWVCGMADEISSAMLTNRRPETLTKWTPSTFLVKQY